MRGVNHIVEEELDILPLLGTVIYPFTVTPLAIAQPSAVRLIDSSVGAPRRVGVVTLRPASQRPQTITLADCFTTGTLALIHRLLRLPDGSLRVAVEGLERIELLEIIETEPQLRARVRLIPDVPAEPAPLAPAIKQLKAALYEIARQPPGISQELLAESQSEEDPQRLSYLVAGPLLSRAPIAERQRLLEIPNVAERISVLVAGLSDLPVAEPEVTATETIAPTREMPGRARWLRYGSSGCELSWVEALQLPQSHELIQTGQHGATAYDAFLIARSWIMANAAELGVHPPSGGLHVHIPAGSPREERLSASGPIALALLSMLRQQGPHSDAALIAELQLHGQLLPVGRLRERAVAALHSGITTLILSSAHAEELATLPAELRSQLQFILADNLLDVIDDLI